MKQNRAFLSTCAVAATVFLCGQVGFSQNTTSASSSDKKFVVSALQGGNAEVKLGQPTLACKAYAELDAVYGSKVRADLRKQVEQAKTDAHCS